MRRQRFQRTTAPPRPATGGWRALAVLLGIAAAGAATGRAAAQETAGSGGSVNGSVTARANLRGGAGNDDISTRLGLEWTFGSWSGGLAAQAGNRATSGAMFSVPRWGSFEMPERWIAWRRAVPADQTGSRMGIETRLGTSYGLRFGQGLVLGSASFEGLQLILDPSPRHRLIAIAGRTEALDPAELWDRPLTLFPELQQLGREGELTGLRGEIRPADGMTLGLNALQAEAAHAPAARLGSVDFAWSRGMVDVAGELAARQSGGSGLYLRAGVSASDAWGVSVAHRRYSSFGSPLGNAPLYSGLSAGDARDERGWLVQADFAPAHRVSGSVSFDYSEGATKDPSVPRRRFDQRLSLRFLLSDKTSLAYGLEHEDAAGTPDGSVHTLLATHSFARGGRLAARFAYDRATAHDRRTVRLSYRVPLWRRRITLLVDDSLRLESGATSHETQVGGTFQLPGASFLTVRATFARDQADGVDITWYRRF